MVDRSPRETIRERDEKSFHTGGQVPRHLGKKRVSSRHPGPYWQVETIARKDSNRSFVLWTGRPADRCGTPKNTTLGGATSDTVLDTVLLSLPPTVCKRNDRIRSWPALSIDCVLRKAEERPEMKRFNGEKKGDCYRRGPFG